MKLSFVGDLGKLNRLARDIGESRARRFLGDLARDFADEGLRLVQEGFQQGIDPTGRPWPRGKKRGGKPGLETGHLYDSWKSSFTYQRAEVFSNSRYAAALHRGTKYIKPHRMVPSGRLPGRWKNRLQPIFFKNMQALLRGSR